MKIFLALIFISFHAYAGNLCEVYGISDSPQALTCTFQREKTTLTCSKGTYLLGNEVVEMAYHLEVEEGPTPLVFRTKTGELTVTIDSGRHHDAVLSRDGKKMNGNCRL